MNFTHRESPQSVRTFEESNSNDRYFANLIANFYASTPNISRSQVQETIYRAPSIFHSNQLITINDKTGFRVNENKGRSWKSEAPLLQYPINEDLNPTILQKTQEKDVSYDQNASILFTKPPKPAPLAPNTPVKPASPVTIRQESSRPTTPITSLIREAPPRPPSPVPEQFLHISRKRLSPPPPRRAIVEKLPQSPPNTQSYVERWLSHTKPERTSLLKNDERDPIILRETNVIVEWETPDVVVKKELKDFGVVDADPEEYVKRYGPTLKRPDEFPDFVKNIRPPNGLILAADKVPSGSYILTGDVLALSLVDLDSNELAECKKYVSLGNLTSPSTVVQPINVKTSEKKLDKTGFDYRRNYASSPNKMDDNHSMISNVNSSDSQSHRSTSSTSSSSTTTSSLHGIQFKPVSNPSYYSNIFGF